ncbi:MAG: hypothetical protein MSC31_05545 [Solirubrobacteraceae bacterium MAG38_C4-C5]|nr:hypothetical protein [Candidatus Siliceabacter maunaloa]
MPLPLPRARTVRRVLTFLVTLVLCLAGVVGVLAFFNARDASTVGEQPRSPGEELPPLADEIETPGNVFLRTGDGADLPGLRALGEKVAGEPTSALRATGQAVVVEQDASIDGIEAVSAGSSLTVEEPDDPELEEFVSFWLGKTEE